MNKLKNSQFDMIPIIISLVFFFFLVIFSLIIYFNYWLDKIEKHRDFIKKIDYFSLGEQIISLPELNCGNLEDAFSCFDLYKVIYFNESLNNNDFLKRNLKAKLFKAGQKRVEIIILFNNVNQIACSKIDLNNLFLNIGNIKNLPCSYYILYNESNNVKNNLFFKERNIIKFPILIKFSYKNNVKKEIAILKVISYY